MNGTEINKNEMKNLIKTRNMFRLTPKHSYDTVFYGNPETTLFQTENKKQINHSREYVAIKPDTDVTFQSTISFKIPKSFDLIENMFIQFSLPSWFSFAVSQQLAKNEIRYEDEENDRFEYVNGIGYYLFESIELRINGKEIQTLTPEMLHIYHKYSSTTNTNRSVRAELHGYFDNPTCYDQTPNIMTKYVRNDNYVVKLPFYFALSESSKLLISTLRDKDCEVIFRIRPLEKVIYNPNNRNELCNLTEPFGRTITFRNTQSQRVEHQALTKDELLIENFELLASVIYLPSKYREILVNTDHHLPVSIYEEIHHQFESAKVMSNKLQIPIETIGLGRFIYVFARLRENSTFNEYANLSRSTNSEILLASRAFPILKNISLVLNREEHFIDKTTNILELEENNIYTHFQSTFDPIYRLDLTNLHKSGIIWSNYDDIRIKLEFYPNINKDIDIYVILYNQNILRFNHNICSFVYS